MAYINGEKTMFSPRVNITRESVDIVHETGDREDVVMSQKAVTEELNKKLDKTNIVQTTGNSETDVMSQKAVTDKLAEKIDTEEFGAVNEAIENVNDNLAGAKNFYVINGKCVNGDGAFSNSTNFDILVYDINGVDVISEIKTNVGSTSLPFYAIKDYDGRVLKVGRETNNIEIPEGASRLYVSYNKAVIEQKEVFVDFNAFLSFSRKRDVKHILDNSDAFIAGVPSQNLFNKNSATVGKCLNTSNGLPTTQSSHALSDFIPVIQGETYSATQIVASGYYDSHKEYVSAMSADTVFTIPDGVSFVRLSVPLNKLDTYQFVKGDTLPEYTKFGAKINNIDDAFTVEAKEQIKGLFDTEVTPDGDDGVSVAQTNIFDKFREHLQNPFVKTQIKLLGDSITHGMGGTGFSATGEQIPGSAGKQNILTATCWSNMLYHYINDNYNKNVEVSPLDERIKYNSPSNNKFVFGTNQIKIEGVSGYVNYYEYARHIGNIAISNAVEFTFYGDHFSMFYNEDKYQGIFEIYVDDTKILEVDAYAVTTTQRKKVDVTGLSLGEHNVRIATTGRRNESASATQFNLCGLIIPKTAIVKPWGVSGSTSKYPLDLNTLYDSSDDFVIMQFGTNDRHVFFTPDATCENLIDATNTIKNATGADVILMASCPASYNFEYGNDAVRYYHMWDVRNAVAKASEKLGMPYVDNYSAFMRYASEHNSSIDELLADGLHPNDLGYKVMYENIMRTFGLPIIPEYTQI